MISADLKIEKFEPQKIEQAVEKASYKNIGHAAASIRKSAMASIVLSEGPSAPGTPPHTHTRRRGKKRRGGGSQLKRAIVYANDRKAGEAVIGPRYSIVGVSGAVHEFGEVYKQTDYPERPFMGPALNRNLDRFAASFAGSIGD